MTTVGQYEQMVYSGDKLGADIVIFKQEPCEEVSCLVTPKHEHCEEEAQKKGLFDGTITFKQEPCEESQNAELSDKHESIFDVKFEELDVSETTISAYPPSLLPILKPTNKVPDYLFKSSKNKNADRPSKKNKKGTKLYTCKICDYSTTQCCHLKRHVRIHTGERPFRCAICGHASSRRSGLALHLKTHTGERPLQCDLCEYSCSQRGNLTRHIRTHTGETPYQCAVCGHAAKQSGDIKKHMSTHRTTRSNTRKNKKRKRLSL